MALLITEECINCDVCEPLCPNNAIFAAAEYYEIRPERCTECIGHYETPQCVTICPVACIQVNPEHREDRDGLYRKYLNLTAGTRKD